MDEQFSTEVCYNIWDDHEGTHIRVGHDMDVGGWVQIKTEDHASEEYYGQFDFMLSPQMALRLAAAIKDVAERLLAEDKER